MFNSLTKTVKCELASLYKLYIVISQKNRKVNPHQNSEDSLVYLFGITIVILYLGMSQNWVPQYLDASYHDKAVCGPLDLKS